MRIIAAIVKALLDLIYPPEDEQAPPTIETPGAAPAGQG
jgi:hypothetical protein